MAGFDGEVKCCFLADTEKNTNYEKIHVEFEYVNGDLVSENELVDIGGERWEHKIPLRPEPYLWKIENYTPDIASNYWQRRCFAVMFRTIGLVIPMKYRSVRDNSQKAFFNMSFTKDLNVFNNRKSVLAQAYLYHPQNNAKYNGLMQWNDNWMFTIFGDQLPAWLVDPKNYTEGETYSNGFIKVLRTQPLLHIGMHELKHNHGYRHDLNSPESILYPYAKRGTKSKYTPDGKQIINEIIKSTFRWTVDDLKRWEEGYGRRNLAVRWLNYFRARRVRPLRVPNLPYYVVA